MDIDLFKASLYLNKYNWTDKPNSENKIDSVYILDVNNDISGHYYNVIHCIWKPINSIPNHINQPMKTICQNPIIIHNLLHTLTINYKPHSFNNVLNKFIYLNGEDIHCLYYESTHHHSLPTDNILYWTINENSDFQHGMLFYLYLYYIYIIIVHVESTSYHNI